jgi:hypothetical protein
MVTTTLKDLFLKERVDLGTAFRFFDKDLDGEVSSDELKAGLEQLHVALPDDRMQAVVKAIDRDGDGAIDLAEFFAQFGAGTGVDFYAQSRWRGPRDGYCFRKGPRGVGMYLDVGLENRLLLEGPTVGIGEEAWQLGIDGVEPHNQIKHDRLSSLLNAPKAPIGLSTRSQALADKLHNDRVLAPLRQVRRRSPPPKPKKRKKAPLPPPPPPAAPRLIRLNGVTIDMEADYVWQTREWILQHDQRQREKVTEDNQLITPSRRHGGMYKNGRGQRSLKYEWGHTKPDPRASFLDRELQVEYDGPGRAKVVEVTDGLTLIPQVQPGRKVKGHGHLGFTPGWRAYGSGGVQYTKTQL